MPLVIAHRGASGYRPENTLEAFALGLSQGAQGIEFDLVLTQDHQLIIRHENALAGTTDISTKPEFAQRKRQGQVDSVATEDWFSEDFTLAEIKTLRAIERLPDLRPGSQKFDGQYDIPTFAKLARSDFIAGKLLVAEIKDGTHIHSIDAVAELVSGQISAQPINYQLVIESFNIEILLATKKALAAIHIPAEYFLLLDNGTFDSVSPFIEQLDGISISMEMLFGDVDWVNFARENSLQIWAYTAKAEDAETSIEAYYQQIIQTGVDGIFADQPDLLRRVIADSTGTTYDY